MEPIILTFLGTGNAVPTAKRNHTSIFLTYKNLGIVIDCGEGTQRQFQTAGISHHKITHLCITHWHGDHILGLPGLIQSLGMSDYQKTLHLFGPLGTKHFMQAIKTLITGMPIKLEVYEILRGTILETEDCKIEAWQVHHDCPALAYTFTIKEKRRLDKEALKKSKLPNIPLLGQLAQGKDIVYQGKKYYAKEYTYTEPGRKIAIILDTGNHPDLPRIAQDADLLITEASFAEAEKEKANEYHHLTSSQAAQIAKQAQAKALMLTHISPRYEHQPERLIKEAKKIFKNVKAAQDFDVITL
jgi:ribonuclease Z